MPLRDLLVGRRLEVIEPLKHATPLSAVSEFSVSADSVVVRVRFVLDEAIRRVSIDWGDLQAESIKVIPGLAVALPEGNSVPDGKYEFVHAYDPPDDGQPFEKNILVMLEDDNGRLEVRQAPVTVSPRYQVTLYTAVVSLLRAAPRNLNTTPGFEIRLLVGGSVHGRWEWNPQYGGSTSFALNGSAISYDLEHGASTIVRLVLVETITEGSKIHSVDLTFDLADIESLAFIGLHSGMEISKEEATDQGLVGIQVDRNISLIRDLPSTGSLASYEKNRIG